MISRRTITRYGLVGLVLLVATVLIVGCIPTSDEKCEDCPLSIGSFGLFNFPVVADWGDDWDDDWGGDDDSGSWNPDTDWDDGSNDSGYCDALLDCACEDLSGTSYDTCINGIALLTEDQCRETLQAAFPECL